MNFGDTLRHRLVQEPEGLLLEGRVRGIAPPGPLTSSSSRTYGTIVRVLSENTYRHLPKRTILTRVEGLKDSLATCSLRQV